MNGANWAEYRRILAVRLDNIGDVVMLTPALKALRRAAPQARITLMATPSGSQVAPMLPWVDDVLVHRPLWQELGAAPFQPGAQRALIEQLRDGRYDAALIFTSFSQSPYPAAYACYLAGIPLRAGQSREFGGGVLDPRVRPLPDEAYQVDSNLHLLAGAGVEPGDRRLELVLPPGARPAAGALLAEAGVPEGQPYVAIAPSASCDARSYDAGRFAEAAGTISARAGMPVVVLGSGRDAPIEPLFRRPGVVSLIGRTSLPEFAAIIAGAEAVLTCNSAALHVASAFGRPVVVLYSGTDLETQWLPPSGAVALRRPTECSPCYLLECPYGKPCLDIDPREVAEVALSQSRAGAAVGATP